MGEYQRLIDAMTAAGFSSRELGIIAESSMGTALDGVTQATDPVEQALALVQFADRYGLLANLRRAVLYTGADRPALQNLLLGEFSMNGGDGQPNLTYIITNIDRKLDQVLTEQNRQAQTIAGVIQRQTDADRRQAEADRRIEKIEAGAVQKPSAIDRMVVLSMVVLMVGLLAFTVYGTVFR